MKGFYGEPSEGKEGIVGGVAKALVKELTGKPAEIVETKIELIDSKVDFDTPPSISKSPDGKIGVMSPFEGEGKVFDADQKQEALSYFRQQKEKFEQEISKRKQSTQHSIEMRQQVQKGQPLFKEAEAQYRIESVRNIIEAIKGFNGSP